MAARGQQSPVAHPSLSLCLRLRCGLVSVTVVTGPGAAQAWSWRHQAAITRSSCSLRLYLLCLSLLCSQCYTTYAMLCCYIIVMGVKCTMVSGCSCYRGVVGNTLFQKFQFMLYLNGINRSNVLKQTWPLQKRRNDKAQWGFSLRWIVDISYLRGSDEASWLHLLRTS